LDNLTNMTKAQLLEQLNSVRDQRDEAIKERDRQVSALDRALAQIERMLIERDGLRRELSEVIASYHGEDTVAIAVERGWNCFENCTQVGGEWIVNEGKA
jgi:septum formation topological specificity factor MinE